MSSGRRGSSSTNWPYRVVFSQMSTRRELFGYSSEFLANPNDFRNSHLFIFSITTRKSLGKLSINRKELILIGLSYLSPSFSLCICFSLSPLSFSSPCIYFSLPLRLCCSLSASVSPLCASVSLSPTLSLSLCLRFSLPLSLFLCLRFPLPLSLFLCLCFSLPLRLSLFLSLSLCLSVFSPSLSSSLYLLLYLPLSLYVNLSVSL